MAKYTMDMTDYEGYKEREFNIISLMAYYAKEIDKTEYPDFEGWMWDMKRSGLITERRNVA